MEKYPRIMLPSYMTVDKDMIKSSFKCSVCGKPFEKGERIAYIGTQHNWFRGDDTAEYYHKKCKAGE